METGAQGRAPGRTIAWAWAWAWAWACPFDVHFSSFSSSTAVAHGLARTALPSSTTSLSRPSLRPSWPTLIMLIHHRVRSNLDRAAAAGCARAAHEQPPPGRAHAAERRRGALSRSARTRAARRQGNEALVRSLPASIRLLNGAAGGMDTRADNVRAPQAGQLGDAGRVGPNLAAAQPCTDGILCTDPAQFSPARSFLTGSSAALRPTQFVNGTHIVFSLLQVVAAASAREARMPVDNTTERSVALAPARRPAPTARP